MPIFMLTFSKEVDVSVEAESEEALRKAAEEAKDDLDYSWDTGDWEIAIFPVKPIKGQMPQAECGLVGNKILEYDEYEEELAKKKEAAP